MIYRRGMGVRAEPVDAADAPIDFKNPKNGRAGVAKTGATGRT